MEYKHENVNKWFVLVLHLWTKVLWMCHQTKEASIWQVFQCVRSPNSPLFPSLIQPKFAAVIGVFHQFIYKLLRMTLVSWCDTSKSMSRILRKTKRNKYRKRGEKKRRKKNCEENHRDYLFSCCYQFQFHSRITLSLSIYKFERKWFFQNSYSNRSNHPHIEENTFPIFAITTITTTLSLRR